MDALSLWLRRNLRLLGVLAIALAAVTWAIDLAGWVHECVYCRTQRSAIGVVGLVMLLPDPRRWWLAYPAVAMCFLGASVAADQIFLVIRNINAGRPFGPTNLAMAGGALGVLVGQALLLLSPAPEGAATPRR